MRSYLKLIPLLLLTGCAFPGDGVTSRVKLQVCGVLGEAATVGELYGRTSRKERLAFVSGQIPRTVPVNRVVHAPVIQNCFTAEFGSFMAPAPFWILPPLGFVTRSNEILMRVDSKPTEVFVLRMPSNRLFRIDSRNGALIALPPQAVMISDDEMTRANRLFVRVRLPR